MGSVRRNVVANLLGRLWTALMSFAFVPVYIRLLGIEAYGLIGFFASMMAVFAVLDLGLGLTINRELARAAAQGEAQEEGAATATRDLFRTLELVYWGIAAVIGAGIVLAAPLIAGHWLNLGSVDRDMAIDGIRAMGVTALMRWPVAIYVGAMMGMQRQVQLNLVTSAAATLAGGGVVAVLLLVSRSLPAFFLWQALVAGGQVLILRALAWRGIAVPGHRPRAAWATMRASLGFSAAVTGITLLSIVLTQLDKFVLSRMLPLAEFGHYALAAAIAAVLTTAGAAVESAAFPALSRLVAAGDRTGERRLYHQASQGLALLVVPVTIAIVLFARDLLDVYLRDPVIAEATAPLLGVLVAGNGILALMFMPLSLQLAHGWTRLSLVKNILAVIAFVPLLYLLAARYGALGAACAWLALTTGYLLVEVPVMHRRLLPGAQWRWYVHDIGVPVLAALAVLGLLRLLMRPDWPLALRVALIAAAGLLALLLAAAALPTVRGAVRGALAARSAGRVARP